MEKLSADALRLALVTASMEYYKKYVEGNQDFDNSEQIKEELGKLEAAGPQEYSDAMLACRKRWNNTIDLSCEDFFKMKQFVSTGSKLQAIKHVKESAKCGLKEAKDFVDTYCDYVL